MFILHQWGHLTQIIQGVHGCGLYYAQVNANLFRTLYWPVCTTQMPTSSGHRHRFHCTVVLSYREVTVQCKIVAVAVWTWPPCVLCAEVPHNNCMEKNAAICTVISEWHQCFIRGMMVIACAVYLFPCGVQVSGLPKGWLIALAVRWTLQHFWRYHCLLMGCVHT